MVDPIKPMTPAAPTVTRPVQPGAPTPMPAPAPGPAPTAAADGYAGGDHAIGAPGDADVPMPPPMPNDQLVGAMAKALTESGHITSGVDGINSADVQAWIANYGAYNSEAFQKHMLTGKEADLVHTIEKQVQAPPPHKLKFDEVLKIALKLNDGDVTKALLTTHNAFRQLSRGQEMIKQTDPAHPVHQDTEWFKRNLDAPSLGINENEGDKDVSDDWYHMTAIALASYVDAKKGPLQVAKELTEASETGAAGKPWFAAEAAKAVALLNETTHGPVNTLLHLGFRGLEGLAPNSAVQQLQLARARFFAQYFPNATGQADATGERMVKAKDGKIEKGEINGQEHGLVIGTALAELVP